MKTVAWNDDIEQLYLLKEKIKFTEGDTVVRNGFGTNPSIFNHPCPAFRYIRQSVNTDFEESDFYIRNRYVDFQDFFQQLLSARIDIATLYPDINKSPALKRHVYLSLMRYLKNVVLMYLEVLDAKEAYILDFEDRLTYVNTKFNFTPAVSHPFATKYSQINTARTTATNLLPLIEANITAVEGGSLTLPNPTVQTQVRNLWFSSASILNTSRTVSTAGTIDNYDNHYVSALLPSRKTMAHPEYDPEENQTVEYWDCPLFFSRVVYQHGIDLLNSFTTTLRASSPYYNPIGYGLNLYDYYRYQFGVFGIDLLELEDNDGLTISQSGIDPLGVYRVRNQSTVNPKWYLPQVGKTEVSDEPADLITRRTDIPGAFVRPEQTVVYRNEQINSAPTYPALRISDSNGYFWAMDIKRPEQEPLSFLPEVNAAPVNNDYSVSPNLVTTNLQNVSGEGIRYANEDETPEVLYRRGYRLVPKDPVSITLPTDSVSFLSVLTPSDWDHGALFFVGTTGFPSTSYYAVRKFRMDGGHINITCGEGTPWIYRSGPPFPGGTDESYMQIDVEYSVTLTFVDQLYTPSGLNYNQSSASVLGFVSGQRIIEQNYVATKRYFVILQTQRNSTLGYANLKYVSGGYDIYQDSITNGVTTVVQDIDAPFVDEPVGPYTNFPLSDLVSVGITALSVPYDPTYPYPPFRAFYETETGPLHKFDLRKLVDITQYFETLNDGTVPTYEEEDIPIFELQYRTSIPFAPPEDDPN